MTWTDKPRRLERVFQIHAFPIYFVTAVTAHRQSLLANEQAHQALIEYATRNASSGRAMGRYVLMPDHVHFMVMLNPEAKLSDYVRLLKQKLTMALMRKSELVWQPGYFDRLLRTSERSANAWQYIMNNPLEAGLAKAPADWPYQGEVVPIRF